MTRVIYDFSWQTFAGKHTTSTFKFQVICDELYIQILECIKEGKPFDVHRDDKEDARVAHIMPHGGQATSETTHALLEVTTCPAHQLCCTEFDFETKMIKGLGALISFPERAPVYPRRLVDQLHHVFMVNLQSILAKELINGEGASPKDLEKARLLFSSAAEHGLVDAQTGLARMFLDGVGGPRDSKTALQLLDHAVKQGSTEAQRLIDKTEAQRLIDKCKADTDAADTASETLLAEEEAETAMSLTVKAKELINGEGAKKKDLEKARRLFSSAAEHGIVDAQIGLARMLLDGVGGPQDYNKALQLLDHAVKQGSIEAQCSSASSSFLIESQRLIDKCKVDADAADAASEALLAEEEAEKARSLTVKAKRGKGRKAKARPSKLASIVEVTAVEAGTDTDADAILPTPPTVCTLDDAGDITGRDVEPPESTIGGQTTCIVCFTNPKTHLAAPCGHQCACDTCAAQMNQCPYCREPVAMWVKQRIV